MRLPFSILFFVLVAFAGKAQIDSSKTVCNGVVTDQDTIPYFHLGEATITTKVPSKSNKKYWRKYNKLEKKVIKVYPYAMKAGEIMQECNTELSQLDRKKDQKVYLEEAEEKLKHQFEGDLRNMTISEGVILIKLIDRQTGDTSYELIKEIKSSFSAFMWQSVARLFGHDLKDQYDAEGDDQMIEHIVGRIESGELKVPIDIACSN